MEESEIFEFKIIQIQKGVLNSNPKISFAHLEASQKYKFKFSKPKQLQNKISREFETRLPYLKIVQIQFAIGK